MGKPTRHYIKDISELTAAEMHALAKELREHCRGRFSAKLLASVSDQELVRQCIACRVAHYRFVENVEAEGPRPPAISVEELQHVDVLVQRVFEREITCDGSL